MIILMMGAMLLMMVLMLFLQFFDVSVVVGGRGVVDCFRDSFGLVRGNFLGVIGYTVVRFVLSVAVALPAYVVMGAWFAVQATRFTSTTAAVQPMPLEYAVAASLGNLVTGTLVGALLFTYHVAYYRSLEGASGGSGMKGRDSVDA